MGCPPSEIKKYICQARLHFSSSVNKSGSVRWIEQSSEIYTGLGKKKTANRARLNRSAITDDRARYFGREFAVGLGEDFGYDF